MFRLSHGTLWLAIAASATAIAPRSAAARDDSAKPAARFAGEWVIRSVETAGASTEGQLPPESCLMTIRGDRIEFFIVSLAAGREEKGTFSVVEAGPDGLKVDVRVVVRAGTDLGKQPDREYVSKELWRMTDGGRFQRCFPDDPTGARPTGFSTKKGDGVSIMTFEKRK
jgi:hypothetical protein